MLQHYIMLSWRRLWRERLVNLIRMSGLAIGLASGLIIFLVVNYFFSFDRYHPHMERSYWIVTDIKREHVIPTDAAPRPLAEVLREEYPFVESATRLETFFGRTISIPDGKGGWAKKFGEARNMCFAEPQYFDLFAVEWLQGNRETALNAPNTIVLSERYARKYFDDAQPIGKTIRLDNKVDLTVTGVIKNPPANTQLRYEGLVSYATIKTMEGTGALADWKGLQSMCFALLRSGTNAARLPEALTSIHQKYLSPEDRKHFAYQTFPLADLNHERSGMAPRPVLYALIAVGILLVLAACTNYINLATSQALRRSREVGVRKSVGSTRGQLIRQLMTETALLTTGAVILALLLTQLALPAVNRTFAEMVETLQPDISILDLLEPRALSWFALLIALVVLLSGFYPAKIISGFHPVKALAGQLNARAVGKISVRQMLIGGQLFLTHIFVMAVLAISWQLNHMQQVDWGFRQEAMLRIWLPERGERPLEKLREAWKQVPGVENITFCSDPPASFFNRPSAFSYHTATEPEPFETMVRAADENYLSAFDLKLVAGRNFSTSDTSAREVIVNEKLATQLGVKNVSQLIGKSMRVKDAERVIVGVVKDFRSGDLHQPVLPVTLIHDLAHSYVAVLQLGSGQSAQTEKMVAQIWNQVMPEQVYRADFVDNLLKSFTEIERLLAAFVEICALIAVAMSCLGLYGLATFMAETRAKEIGVRKVLGARVDQLLWVFGREFVKLLCISFLLAAPAGWWLISGWLQQYAHHINPGIALAAATFGITLLIIAGTVLQKVLRASRLNPVRQLRSE